MCQHLPFQGSPKYTQIGIFGVKMNHLATLDSTSRIITPQAETIPLDHAAISAIFLKIGIMGREIEYRRCIGKVVALKKRFYLR
jgi:hypothetical protein